MQPLKPLPDLGHNADLRGFRLFPDNDAWNTPVDRLTVHPRSDILIASIGIGKPLHPDFGVPYGIPYVVVAGTTRRVPVRFEYADESDAGPYPIPADAPIEGGAKSDGDRHVLVLDRDAGTLWETWSSYPQPGGGWKAGSGARFDLRANTKRPSGWTSADAAGLPVFPGLARYDEVVRGTIRHALRFTVVKTRRAFVAPATHFASRSNDPNLPPMGMRVRLKAGVSLARLGPQARVVARALQTYGMILADNGGDWFVSGAPHPRWGDDDLNTLKALHGSDFEVVVA